jgi:FkbM family methyltransferase
MMNVRKLIAAYRQKYLRVKLKLENNILLGKNVRVFKGTVPPKQDKDDAWFYEMSKHHDVIFDVGANMGYCSLLSSIHNPGKTIVLVDPNEEALTYAKENLEQNSLQDNKWFICAFADKESGKQIKFYTIGAAAAGSMFASHSESASAVNSWRWVSTITIDDIVKEKNVIPGLIKIDVEAAEIYALQGAVILASMQATKFFVEMHAPPEMPMMQNAALVIDWCKENKYQPYYLADHTLLLNAEMISHRGRCHLLLLPEGETYP